MSKNNGILYRRQLRKCGFRGWGKANHRRGELIRKKHSQDGLAIDELRELSELQKLCDIFMRWKFQAENRRMAARLRRFIARSSEH